MGKATLSKTLVWKAAALVGGLGLGIVSYPLHAAPASGGDTVQGLYDALLTTMKNGRTLGQSGATRSWPRSFAAPSTSPRWHGYRSDPPGPV